MGKELDPAAAKVVVEVFRRIRAGHSLKSIAADLTERGIRSRGGKVLDGRHLRAIALSPTYVALRMHQPGSRRDSHQGSLANAVEATWPALVDAETFHAVRNVLQDPARKTSRPGRAKHLLSMIAVCDVCDGPMTVSYRRGYREYFCRTRSCCYVMADDLDRHAEQVMLAYLAQPDVIKRLRASGGGELTKVRAALAEQVAELTSWRTAAKAGKVSLASFMTIEPGLIERIAALEARDKELSTPPALTVLPPGKDIARRWKAAPMSARRQVARLLSSPEVLGQLRVCKAPVAGQHCEAENRVVWAR